MTIYLLLFLLFTLLKIFKAEETYIEITDSSTHINKFSVKFIPESIQNLGWENEDLIALSGKLCYVKNGEEIKTNCIEKYESYNYYWVNSINKIY